MPATADTSKTQHTPDVQGALDRLAVAANKIADDRLALLHAAKLAMKVWPDQLRGSLLEVAIAQAEGR